MEGKKQKGKQQKGKEEREEPEKISWRNDSIPVRDQGRVPRQPGKETSKPTEGACWAFAVVSLIAHQHRIETLQQRIETSNKSTVSELLYPSFQHIVDHCCFNADKKVLVKKVGEVKQILKYCSDKGVCSERDYPTLDHLPGPPAKSWRAVIPKTPKIFITDYLSLDSSEIDFKSIKKLLEHHVILGKVPIYHSFVNEFPKEPNTVYTKHSGKYEECSHCVVIIGFGTEDDIDYYELQNSWGSTWGNGGFGKIQWDLIIPFAYVKGVFKK